MFFAQRWKAVINMEGAENMDMIEEKRMKSQLLCVTRRFGKSETLGGMETWVMCG